MQIVIAGISFLISGNDCSQEGKIQSSYRSFVFPSNNYALSFPIDITVSVSIGAIAGWNDTKKIFDSGESWQLYQRNDFLYLTLQPELFHEPFWSARLDREFTEVDLVFNNKFTDKFLGNGSKYPVNSIQYPLDQILLMHHMAFHNKGLLVHSAGIELNGKGFIFPGKSGAGKSTLTHQLAGQDHFELLSDDRMIIRKIDGSFQAFGTPWPGEAGIAVNKSVPLEGLFFIHHADENRVEPIAPKIAVERLMPVSSIPWYDRQAVINLLDFCDDLTSSVPAYDLYFKPTAELADFFQSFIVS